MTTESIAASYRGMLAQPVLRRLAVADVCARLPQGMVSITLLLVAAEHASMTIAGLAVAGYTLGQAVTGPLRGRLADQRGLVPVAAVCTLGYAVALAGLVAGALASAPGGLLIAAAALAGLLNPPLSPGMRSLWATHASARLRQTAFALDAAVFDLAYITGPVVASALATGLAPAAAVAVLLALTGAAILAIARPGTRAPDRLAADEVPAGARPAAGLPESVRPATASPESACAATVSPESACAATASPESACAATASPGGAPARSHPLRSAALRRLLLTAALANAALSATEVALTGYVRHHHALWASGPLLAEVSIGSILGSLLLGARGRTGPWRLPLLLACYAGGLALLTASGLYPPLVAVAAPLAGLCLGPTLATLFGGAAATAPSGGGTETQAWINSIMNGGAAAGAALAGLASGQPILALGLAAAAALAATGAATAGALAGARQEAPQELQHEPADRSARKPDSTGAQASPCFATGRRPAVSSWSPRRVLDAAVAMEWRPDGAVEVLTADYRLIRYPDWALDPTFPAAQVTRSRTNRPPIEIIDEVIAKVREWGLLGVAWWVSAETAPAATEQELRARGGKQVDAVRILARELDRDLPALDIPGDVTTELVADERTFRAASSVAVQGWGRKPPSEADLARDLGEALADLESWANFRVVTFIDGEPASTGGCTLGGAPIQAEVAQLWGAVTLPRFRKRGAYRAVLAERLRLAREHGASLAMVKGRIETSGPILLRAGFTDYGEERCLWLPA